MVSLLASFRNRELIALSGIAIFRPHCNANFASSTASLDSLSFSSATCGWYSCKIFALFSSEGGLTEKLANASIIPRSFLVRESREDPDSGEEEEDEELVDESCFATSDGRMRSLIMDVFLSSQPFPTDFPGEPAAAVVASEAGRN